MQMESDLHGSQNQVFKANALEHVSLVSSINKNISKACDFGRICKVSERFYMENEDKYFPTMVSIGPFHRGEEKLKAMEERKWQYLNTLLSRALNVEARIGKCVEVLKVLEDRARKCYVEEICMGSDEFVEMMLLDGCFIIELFYKACCKGIRRRGDPFLATYHVFFRLRHDLILLENQIPFFVLQHLFDLVPVPKQCGDYTLIELAFRFFKKTIHEDPYDLQERFGQEIHHLLDLIHQSFIPKTHHPQLQSKQPHLQMNISTAAGFHKTGTRIKRAKSRSVLEVKFYKGALRIPPLIYHDLTETVFRNFIAMENSCYDGKKYITSYAFLMKSLIQSNDDAKYLRKKRILDKDEEFVTLFNEISVELDVQNFYYGDLCEEINNSAKVSKVVWFGRKARKHVMRCLRAL
ncbi:hypothetical protein OSB04_009835 [Centaurea solstitialis]|uniref:Uncharacterized protein n=1 Tax=Centaurea solstitialis TaxID=347529 RepID=A0AA38TH84_9ASTR|nr:hypothetical protein OSB04_009835 [Centaurea solstitialis]